MFKKKSSLFFSLDITDQSVSLAGGRIKSDSSQISFFEYQASRSPWPCASETLTQALIELKRPISRWKLPIVMTIPDSWVMTQMFPMEEFPNQEALATDIILRLQQQFALSSQAIYYDFCITEQLGRRVIFVAAAKTELLAPYLKLIERIGYKITTVELESLAYIRALNQFIPLLTTENNKDCIALWKIHFAEILLLIYLKGIPIFSRTERLEMRDDSSEILLHRCERCLQYYLSSPSYHPIIQTYLVGNKDLIEPLQQKMQIHFQAQQQVVIDQSPQINLPTNNQVLQQNSALLLRHVGALLGRETLC